MHSPRSVQPGDHVCTLYATPEEHRAAAIDALSAGLARGNKCLYICGEHTPDEFRAQLVSAGIDAPARERCGALTLITPHDGHLEGGSFDPERMIELLESSLSEALRGGFTGVVAAGDMNWVLAGAEGTEQLLRYEARLNQFFPGKQAIGLCQYNRQTIPARFLDDALATHPLVRLDGLLLANPLYGWREISTPQSESIDRKLRLVRYANEA